MKFNRKLAVISLLCCVYLFFSFLMEARHFIILGKYPLFIWMYDLGGILWTIAAIIYNIDELENSK